MAQTSALNITRADFRLQSVDRPLRSHPANGGRPGAARFNQAVYHRGLLYLSGQIIDNTKAPGMDTYYGQTKGLLRQVEQLLKSANSDMDHLLQVGFQHPCIQDHSGT